MQESLATATAAAIIICMSTHRPYSLTEPAAAPCKAVFTSPHSGRWYPPDFVRHARLDPLALRASEDAFVDQLVEAAPLHGARCSAPSRRVRMSTSIAGRKNSTRP